LIRFRIVEARSTTL